MLITVILVQRIHIIGFAHVGYRLLLSMGLFLSWVFELLFHNWFGSRFSVLGSLGSYYI